MSHGSVKLHEALCATNMLGGECENQVHTHSRAEDNYWQFCDECYVRIFTSKGMEDEHKGVA